MRKCVKPVLSLNCGSHDFKACNDAACKDKRCVSKRLWQKDGEMQFGSTRQHGLDDAHGKLLMLVFLVADCFFALALHCGLLPGCICIADVVQAQMIDQP